MLFTLQKYLMLIEERNATIISWLGEFPVHVLFHCNHISGRDELVTYQLDNHKSRHVQCTIHFESTSLYL